MNRRDGDGEEEIEYGQRDDKIQQADITFSLVKSMLEKRRNRDPMGGVYPGEPGFKLWLLPHP